MNDKSLEHALLSYNSLIGFLFLFIILMVVLLVTNNKGFNTTFGYEIFITLPFLLIILFLIKDILSLKNNPTKSFLNYFSQSSQPWFIPFMYIITAIITIFGFIMTLYVGGVFSDNPPENNIPMLINFFIVIIFISIAITIYSRHKQHDDNILNTLPNNFQSAFHLRTKYTILFLAFTIFVMSLYFFNPFGLMTKYGGPIIFFTLFIGITIVIFITFYQSLLANTSNLTTLNNIPTPLAFLLKGTYILTTITISIGLIYTLLYLMGVFEQDANKPESYLHIIFNIILFSTMLGIIYKLANAGGFLDKNPYYRLVLNTILYIPCLLVSFLNYLYQLVGIVKTHSETFEPPKPFETHILIVSLILLISYFTWNLFAKRFIQSTYLKQGGTQLINQPIPTNILSNVASYQNINGSDNFDYKYAISFWFYIDSFPPSTNASYNKVVPILSYGENPSLKYSSENNTLYITVKQDVDTNNNINIDKLVSITDTIEKWKDNKEKKNDIHIAYKSMPFGSEIDADGNRIIYKHSDVLLQKWNHIVLNYNGGTLDVFYNGRLVKSAIEVTPYIKLDMLTVGSNNGVSGNVANLMYFKEPLDYLTVNTLYTSLKSKNPPTIPDNDKHIIPL